MINETRNELSNEFSNQTERRERDYQYTADYPARFTIEIIMEISRNLESIEILESSGNLVILRKSRKSQVCFGPLDYCDF